MFPFEKLETWQLAKDLAISIYNISKNFPIEEQYGLVNQIKRGVISVASNLAEGSSRISKKDQAHFSQISYSSLMEVMCQLNIALELGFIEEEEFQNLREKIRTVSIKINALRRSQRERME